MKQIIFGLAILFLLSACSSSKKTTNYKTLPDDETKVLQGYINRSVLENDTAFTWFASNVSYGKADASAVEAFKQKGSKFNMLVFAGTWCHDTQAMLPVFYRLVDASNYPDKKITLIALDREKKGVDDLYKTHNVISVPTFIVMQNGEELGRVVEYGKDGNIDKELGEIVMEKVK
jgi:thiol-disulfide isomerase/thioredoxin